MIYYGFDRSYILVIVGMLLCLAASAYVKNTIARYSMIKSVTGLTGSEAAAKILANAGITNVRINHISGNLTDNYNPTDNTLNLSDNIYNSTSPTAIGIAAHECGHAIQHNLGYAPVKIRTALVPITNFGAGISWPLIIIGLLIRSSMSRTLLLAGIICFSLVVLFQLVTLPVEFNASNRAIRILENGMLPEEEVYIVKKVLTAAALTYVASLASSILSLLRIILLANSRSRD